MADTGWCPFSITIARSDFDKIECTRLRDTGWKNESKKKKKRKKKTGQRKRTERKEERVDMKHWMENGQKEKEKDRNREEKEKRK